MAEDNKTDMKEDKEPKETEMKSDKSYGYGKKSMGKWIVIYVVIAVVVYGLIYYFVTHKNSSTGQSTTNSLY